MYTLQCAVSPLSVSANMILYLDGLSLPHQRRKAWTIEFSRDSANICTQLVGPYHAVYIADQEQAIILGVACWSNTDLEYWFDSA